MEKLRASSLEFHSWMLNHPRILHGPEMAVGFIDYEVVPDFSPVDFVEYFKMPVGLTQFLEIFAAFRTGEHTFKL